MGKGLRAAVVASVIAGCVVSPSTAVATEAQDKALSRLGNSVLDFLLAYLWISLLDARHGDDPALLGGVARNRALSGSVNGAPVQFPASRSTFFSGHIWGTYDIAPHLGLAPNQQLFVGAFYRHSRVATDFGPDGRSNSHGHALGGFATYLIDAWRFSAGAGYEWGGGTLTSLPSNATGSFDTNGFSLRFLAGRTITLWGDPAVANRDNPWPHSVRQVSVYFDPAFRAGYASSNSGAFVNSRGTPFGSAAERAWTVGGSFRLSVVVPHGNGVVVSPHVAFMIDRQVDYRHTQALPVTGQIVRLDHDRTSWGVHGGVALWFDRHLSIGLDGFHRAGGSLRASGAMAWLRVNLFGQGGYLQNSLSER